MAEILRGGRQNRYRRRRRTFELHGPAAAPESDRSDGSDGSSGGRGPARLAPYGASQMQIQLPDAALDSRMRRTGIGPIGSATGGLSAERTDRTDRKAAGGRRLGFAGACTDRAVSVRAAWLESSSSVRPELARPLLHFWTPMRIAGKDAQRQGLVLRFQRRPRDMTRLLLLLILIPVAPAAGVPARGQAAWKMGSNERAPTSRWREVGCATGLATSIRLKFVVSEFGGLPGAVGAESRLANLSRREIPPRTIGASVAHRLPHPLRC